MGPERGEEGGLVVAHGTPEQVAAKEGSYTGQFLAGLVEQRAATRATRATTMAGDGRENGLRIVSSGPEASATEYGSGR